jgi:two-component sensor histidine kinase
MFLKNILFTLLIFSSLYSSTIQIDEKSLHVSVLENSLMYIDKNSTLTFKDIQKKRFTPTDTDYIRFGYSPITLWTKFSIKNNSDEKIARYLTVSNPMLDTIELYTKTKDGYKKEMQGMLHLNLYQRNNILHPSFKVVFKAVEIKEFYYKTHTISCAHYFKLHINDLNTLYKNEFSYQLILALFFGAMLALIIYNTFIYFFTREASYLYYVLYIFFITLNHASYSIMINYILISNTTVIAMEAFMAIYYLIFASTFALLFIKRFLEIKQHKMHTLIINTMLFLNMSFLLLSLIMYNFIEYFVYIVLLEILFIFYVTIYSFYKKNSQAKYIIIGWTVNTIGAVMLIFNQYGIPNIIDYFPYFYELSVFIEAILFSVALSSKLNRTKELEKSIKINKILTKELHHRVKNNMQFIILMYRLKLDNLSDEKIEQKLKETEGAVQAMSKTHEILYNQENLETINTKEYFTSLLEELQKSFDCKDIKISLHVETTLDIQYSIYCGIILNELITNSFKYAFKNNKGNIHITLIQKGKKHFFSIEDNGVGFDYEQKQHDSFGLSFIKTIAVDELKGTFTIDSIGKTKIEILF